MDPAIPIAIVSYLVMFMILLVIYLRRANQRAAMGDSGSLTSGEVVRLFLFPLIAVPAGVFGVACLISAFFIFGLLSAFRPK